MGVIDSLKGKRVYFDANTFIYLLEGSDLFESALYDIQKLISDNEIEVAGCELLYTELLPFHAKRQDQTAIEHIVGFLEQFHIAAITKSTAIHAGILRGETGMKTPDALHIASAIEQECDVFLTNDKGIRVPEGMARILISEL